MVDRQHPYSYLGSQIASEMVGLRVLPGGGDYYGLHRFGPSTTSTLHPGSPDAAYAQYLIAASLTTRIPDVSPRPAPAPRRRSPLLERVGGGGGGGKKTANIRTRNTAKPPPRPRSEGATLTTRPARK